MVEVAEGVGPPRVWKTGERARVTYEGRSVLAQVVLASPNGRSLALSFEALLGGYAGLMPVLWNARTEQFECIVVGIAVKIEEEKEPDV